MPRRFVQYVAVKCARGCGRDQAVRIDWGDDVSGKYLRALGWRETGAGEARAGWICPKCSGTPPRAA